MEAESTEVQITQKQEQKEETLPKKRRDFQMKGTNKHMEAELISFDNHRCLSQSEENKCM